MPGSGELVAVREVVASVQAGGQIEHQVMKRGVLEHLGVRQGRMAARPLLTTPERTVQIQHHVAEHVAHQQQSQEIVPEKLQHAALCESRCGEMVNEISATQSASDISARFVEEEDRPVRRIETSESSIPSFTRDTSRSERIYFPSIPEGFR